MNWKQKLSSRKLWAAIAGVIVGLVVAFGGDGESIQQVAGSVMSVVSAIIYILAEAGVDKASAASTEVHILPEDGHDAQNH
jgi:hypothetical protein